MQTLHFLANQSSNLVLGHAGMYTLRMSFFYIVLLFIIKYLFISQLVSPLWKRKILLHYKEKSTFA